MAFSCSKPSSYLLGLTGHLVAHSPQACGFSKNYVSRGNLDFNFIISRRTLQTDNLSIGVHFDVRMLSHRNHFRRQNTRGTVESRKVYGLEYFTTHTWVSLHAGKTRYPLSANSQCGKINSSNATADYHSVLVTFMLLGVKESSILLSYSTFNQSYGFAVAFSLSLWTQLHCSLMFTISR